MKKYDSDYFYNLYMTNRPKFYEFQDAMNGAIDKINSL